MGHAGAVTLPREPDAQTKINHLQDAGVTIVNHPAKFGDAMKTLLASSGRASSGASTSGLSQRRSMHTMRRVRPQITRQSFKIEQRRHLYVQEDQSFDLMRERGINASVYSGQGRRRVSSQSLLCVSFLLADIDHGHQLCCMLAIFNSDIC